jgi:trimeric autotransporter adhesin
MKTRNTISIAILSVLVCIGLLPKAQAVIPAPDGGYANFTTAEGQNALFSLTTGSANTAVGWFSLFSNAEGSFNTATGAGALLFNTANENTAFGAAALLFNTTGSGNTAVGAAALLSNTTGEGNTATGTEALNSNTSGDANTATGDAALFFNTIGANNTATGTAALFFNTGSFNTATGRAALFGNTTGSFNTATGTAALENNTTGESNTATGYRALLVNTEGTENTANGESALLQNTTGDRNTAVGRQALTNNTTGDSNTALGQNAGLSITGSGNVCICDGVFGDAGVNDSTYIRNVNTLLQNFSAGVNNYVTVRLTDGRLGHTAVVSSQRYKEEIKPLDKTSQALYALKPVSFRLKKEFDPTQTLGFGLIAEEVENVDPALVYHNNKGQVESVRYEMVNAMLLNEFLKEHKKVEQLEGIVATLAATVNEQAAKIEKVSAQLEVSKAVGQTALNNP